MGSKNTWYPWQIELIKLTVNLQSTLFNVACLLVAWNVGFALNLINLSLSLVISQLLWLLFAHWQWRSWPIGRFRVYAPINVFLQRGEGRHPQGPLTFFKTNLSIIPTVGWYTTGWDWNIFCMKCLYALTKLLMPNLMFQYVTIK